MRNRHPLNGMQFRLRTLLGVIAVIAIVIGLYTSIQREHSINAKLVEQLANARDQIRMSDTRGKLHADAESYATRNGIGGMSAARFDRVNLSDLVIQGGDRAFQ